MTCRAFRAEKRQLDRLFYAKEGGSTTTAGVQILLYVSAAVYKKLLQLIPVVWWPKGHETSILYFLCSLPSPKVVLAGLELVYEGRLSV